MRKILSVILLVNIVIIMMGCSKQKDSVETVKTDTQEVQVIVEDVIDEGMQLEENEEEVIGEMISIPDITIEAYDIPDNDAMEFVNGMKIGWNLGNTFDAINDNSNFTDELQYESTWSGVVTTKEMIDLVKLAGFNTIRIPVSWHNHVSGEDFAISEIWMDRVQEVVDYAMENDMYIILNIHHDISEDYFYPNSKNLETSTNYITSIWSQIATRFQDYDEHVIFEGMNEPRLVGTENEWWLDINSENCIDAVDCINQLNQSFVDTIRAGDGNNTSRYLMVSGYCASSDGALTDLFKLPEDIRENKIIVSVHAYTPYNFALQDISETGSTTDFSTNNANDTDDIDYFMDKLYDKYISIGIPVVIGEFGARDKENNLLSRVEYATYYIGAARARGMICCWWDNNAYSGSGENFGILNRSKLEWEYPEIVEGLMKY